MNDNSIHLNNISMHFDLGARKIEALSGISFGIRRNSFVSIVGRSGCGKSTLLRIISGLIEPTSGSASIDGLAPLDYRKNKQFGFVFQEPGLLPWKTASQNVSLPLEILKAGDRAACRRKALDLLGLVRLDGFEHHYPKQLSGGMRQRVAIARALSYQPDIILMDEPFGALDDFTRREMHDELIRIWREQKVTVVFVTHSLNEALYLSDRIVVLSPNPGRVKQIIDVESPRTADRLSSASFHRQVSELEGLVHEH